MKTLAALEMAERSNRHTQNCTSLLLHVFQVEAANTFDYMVLSDMPQAVRETRIAAHCASKQNVRCLLSSPQLTRSG